MAFYTMVVHFLLVILCDMYGIVESRIFVSYNRANTMTYTAYRRNTYSQSNTRLMWIFVGFFFGSVILVLLCFFCYIKCRRKQEPAERNADPRIASHVGPRYDVEPPRYTPTAEGGHHTLKPSEGQLPPRYSDIINAAGETLPSQGAVGNPAANTTSVSASDSETVGITGTQSEGMATSSEISEEQEHTVSRDSDSRKSEKDTRTHDKAGLIDNEVDNGDEG